MAEDIVTQLTLEGMICHLVLKVVTVVITLTHQQKKT